MEVIAIAPVDGQTLGLPRKLLCSAAQYRMERVALESTSI
jgi:hypothetical protein